MFRIGLRSAAALFCCSVLLLCAAAGELRLEAECDRDTAVYRAGETVSFRFRLAGDDVPADAVLEYLLEREDGLAPARGSFPAGKPASVETRTDQPGFFRLTVTARDAAGEPLTGKDGKPLRVLAGAGVDPEKIETAIPEPADFDLFWARKRELLVAAPMRVLERNELPLPPEQAGRFRAFDIRIACAGPKPVSGYLTIPAGAKARSLPAILSVHGAGVRSASVMRGWAADAITLDINAHGIENGKEPGFYRELERGELRDYIFRIGGPRDDNYFLWMALRVVRALEYLKSLPEYDGRHLIIVGGSQGGAQALLGAGLDPDVSLCIAHVPWLTALSAASEGRLQPRWPKTVRPGDVPDSLPYLDAANFAWRINAECVLTVGYADDICTPSGIWITYNRIPGIKQIFPFPKGGHGGTHDYNALRKYLDRIAAETP